MAYTPAALAKANAILNAGMLKAIFVKEGPKASHPPSSADSEALGAPHNASIKTSAQPVKRGRGRPKGIKLLAMPFL